MPTPMPKKVHYYHERPQLASTVLCLPFSDSYGPHHPATTAQTSRDRTQVTCRRCLRKLAYLKEGA